MQELQVLENKLDFSDEESSANNEMDDIEGTGDDYFPFKNME